MKYVYRLHRAKDLLFVIETDFDSGEKMYVSIGSFPLNAFIKKDTCALRCQQWLQENHPEMLL